MKKLIALLLCLALTLSFVGCTPKSEAEVFNVGTLKGPSSIGLVKVMDTETPLGENTTVNFDIQGAPDNIVAKLINKELDAACVPINLAATLYNKTNGEIVLVSVASKGVLHLLTKGETITSLQDLSGKTVYSSGQGSTPQFILEYLLKANNVENVNVIYLPEHAAVVSQIVANGGIALLPEPHATTATMQDPEITRALNITDVWEATNAEAGIYMTAFVVRKDFLEENPGTVELFLKAYEESTKFANENPAQAGELSAKYGIVPKAAVAQAAIPGCNLIYMGAKENKATIEKFYEVLFNANPKSIGGKMPLEDFYR